MLISPWLQQLLTQLQEIEDKLNQLIGSDLPDNNACSEESQHLYSALVQLEEQQRTDKQGYSMKDQDFV